MSPEVVNTLIHMRAPGAQVPARLDLTEFDNARCPPRQLPIATGPDIADAHTHARGVPSDSRRRVNASLSLPLSPPERKEKEEEMLIDVSGADVPRSCARMAVTHSRQAYSLAEFEPIHHNRTPFEDVSLDSLNLQQELRRLLGVDDEVDAEGTSVSPLEHEAPLSYIEEMEKNSTPQPTRDKNTPSTCSLVEGATPPPTLVPAQGYAATALQKSLEPQVGGRFRVVPE